MTEMETWYVLEDGEVAHPSQIKPDAKDNLKHKDGRMVAMRGEVPSTRGVHPEEHQVKSKNREMKPDKPERGYRTR